jgi:hypothetical protein
MLLVLGLAPVAMWMIGSGFGAGSVIAVSTPPVLTGLLYLFAEIIRRQAAGPDPMPVAATPPAIRQPGPLPAGDADGPGQHTPGADGTHRDTRGQDTPRRAA